MEYSHSQSMVLIPAFLFVPRPLLSSKTAASLLYIDPYTTDVNMPYIYTGEEAAVFKERSGGAERDNQELEPLIENDNIS